MNKVSFSGKSSEILGCLGPNGAGKTTAIKIFAGLLKPKDGGIFHYGRNMRKDMNDYKKKLGYAPKESDIYLHLKAYDYLLIAGRLRQIPENVLHRKIKQFMKLFGLSEDMHAAMKTIT